MRQPRVILVALLALLASCGDSEPTSTPTGTEEGSAPEPQGDAVTTTAGSGPVLATVSVQPSEPRLGDTITLTLTVEADPGYVVEMPAFGEALGRFVIVSFTPREVARPDGGRTLIQEYSLQPPMSGRQRIPQLALTFYEETGDDPETHEVLTEELAIEVASVLPEEEEIELYPALGALPLRVMQPVSSPWWYALFIPVVIALLVLLWYVLRSALRERRRRTAYDIAMARLRTLRERGIPGPEQVDPWYVELSDVVRRYLENRFGLRAPELTTEEFLNEAKRSAELTSDHQGMLTRFLEHCDRVKFAGYIPSKTESNATLDDAVDFLEETRLEDDRRRQTAKGAAATSHSIS